MFKKLIIVLMIMLGVSASNAVADNLLLPNSLSVIEDEAFYNNKSIYTVELPQGIQKIKSKAFGNSALRYINLPDSLTFIAADAFDKGVTVTANSGTYAYEWAIRNGFIKAPKEPDQLEYPQIIMDDIYECGIDVEFQVERDLNADDYYFNLYRDNEQLYWDFHFWEPFSYVFFGYDLQPGNYKLVLTATADDYESNTATKHFTITGNKHIAPSVTVDNMIVMPNQEYTFSINSTGAEKVLAREYFYGGYSSEIVDVDSDVMTFTYSNLTRKKSYKFCLLIDGHWSDFSNEITIAPLE